jgi:hypothetical protein
LKTQETLANLGNLRKLKKPQETKETLGNIRKPSQYISLGLMKANKTLEYLHET